MSGFTLVQNRSTFGAEYSHPCRNVYVSYFAVLLVASSRLTPKYLGYGEIASEASTARFEVVLAPRLQGTNSKRTACSRVNI